ncbi:MAG: hypothetical protein WC491_08600 [Candidatus Omnitrophota bacterium]
MTDQEKFDQIIVSWQDPSEFLKYVWFEETGKGALQFRRLPHLLDLWDTLLHHRNVIVLKSRQIAVSWTLAGYCCWKMVTKPMSRVLIISKGDEEAQYFLSHVKFIYRNLLAGTGLPSMTDLMPPSPDSSDAIGIVWDTVSGTKSEVRALPCTATAGTGYTATDVICDEYDKWRTTEKGLTIQEKSFSALKPTVDRTGGTFIVCSTTEIFEPDSFYKKLWYGAKENDNGFTPRFYDATKHPLFGPEWWEEVCRSYKGKEYLRRQDYPLTEEEALTPPGEERIFSGADQLATEARNVTWTQRKPFVHVLQPFVAGWKYVAGADVASGHGDDYSVLTIVGKKGLDAKVVAVIRSRTLTTNQFAREIYDLCETYSFPLLAVERNNMGVAVVDDLVAMRYPKLYYKDENAKKQGKPGVDTTQSARQRGPSEQGEKWIWKLAESINGGTLTTTFLPQVTELQDFFWIDGKAMARGHDDTVMSLAITNSLLDKAPHTGPMPVIKFKGAGTFAMR